MTDILCYTENIVLKKEGEISMRAKIIKKILSAGLAAAMIVTSVPALAPAGPVEAVGDETADNLLRLWYDEPATDWQQQTIPIGNGDMGANILRLHCQ